MTTRLAIFDIDGTLIPGASTEVRFVRYLRRQHVLGARQIAAYAWFCVRYGLQYGSDLKLKNKAYLSGLKKTQVEQLATAFVRDELLPILYQPVLERLRAHQAAADVVALLSGTPQFLATALAEGLTADCGYGALCALRSGIFRAAPMTRHPYGATKVTAARELAQQTGLALTQAVAYGDSVHDGHLFRVVSEAVAVQPDRGLDAMATDEGWEILID